MNSQPNQCLNEKQVAVIMQQLFSGLTFCHGHKIVHRDLKPQNILLGKSNEITQVKIIDWEIAKKFNPEHNMRYNEGYNYYLAPEVFKGDYNQKIDIWSLGAIMYFLLCGYRPFEGTTNQEIMESIKEGN